MAKPKEFTIGRIGEERVMSLLHSVDIFCEPNDKYADRYQYDLRGFILHKNKPLPFKIEVKYDAYEKRSGNVAIEVRNSRQDRPSGITATESHIWAHVLHDSIWFTPVTSLLAYTEWVKPERRIEHAGDGNATILLYKRDIIMPDIFTQVDDFDQHDFEEWIVECMTH